MAKTSGQQGNTENREEKPDAPEKRVYLVLTTEVDGIGAHRVVSAGETRAEKLIKANHARKATASQVAHAGGRIPQLAG